MKLEDLPRFYAGDVKLGTTLQLPKDEAHHLHVLRQSKGDLVHVMNGKGSLFEAEVVHTKRAELRIINLVSETKPGPERILLVAPTKNIARFEWVIEKSTELGITQVVPIQCEHSERVKLKEDRLLRIAASAAKQSKELFMPTITPMMSIKEALKIKADHRWLAHCKDSKKSPLVKVTQAEGTLLIAIGPEGDFSEQEVSLALESGFQPLSLGEKRLRTETAAIASALAMTLFTA